MDVKNFLEINKNKEVVVVQGLGFVGAVMSLVVSNTEKDYAVIGIDLKKNIGIINSINNGIFPINHQIQKLISIIKKLLKEKFISNS